MNSRILLLIILWVFSFSCSERDKEDNKSCGENPEMNKLFVFIGEKIGVKELTDEEGIMDLKFKARKYLKRSVAIIIRIRLNLLFMIIMADLISRNFKM